ncbi:methyltransferase type 11 [Salipaludibacillus neizhouensis]|uniref:Methyltransferase type 11 n=1 Tax=Salipaludibacillus neizhouensis TaxID=885475 RepID=A0A3A9K7Y9_9BACI|nr:class I SAM-dependent methyltransferase [Salipaludibacillus neizhouensis]RKL68647.1 methyltransferase type 11 [Salipaludibacillus neizhouensis]
MKHDHFASLYDSLMEDAPYKSWLSFATTNFPDKGSILDLACGTGTFTCMLAKQGFTMFGVDLSQDMLTIADDKKREQRLNIPFILQDMRSFSGFEQLDGITLFCDGLNYLLDSKDVKQTFQQAYSALKSDGVFLFDVHSEYKMEYIFSNQLYGENGEDISYMWFCEQGEETLSIEHELTFFLKKQDGSYERIDETQYQRTFQLQEYKQWLEEAGFQEIEISSDFGESTDLEEKDRIFFKAVKK